MGLHGELFALKVVWEELALRGKLEEVLEVERSFSVFLESCERVLVEQESLDVRESAYLHDCLVLEFL